MKREKISEIIDNIDIKYVDEAISYEGKTKSSKKKTWYRWGTVAACFALLVVVGTKVIPMLTEGEDVSHSKYKYHVLGMEDYIEWPWEYKSIGEKYQTIVYDGREYSIKSGNPISADVMGSQLGTGEATGIDVYTDRKYTENFQVYEIRGVSEQKLVAAGMDGEYYVYQISEEDKKPATFGELMALYGLEDNLEFKHYTVYEGYKGQEYYTVNDDSYIWQILSECDEAVLDNSKDSFDRDNRNYLSFTATSDALGVYKRVVYISEDGYFATNIFDYSYIYFIGIDAARNIINYADNNSKIEKPESYEPTVSGTLIEISDDYILIDDSVLCNNKEDSTVYKIFISDIRIKRCIYNTEIKVGDIVVVKYKGEISQNNEVIGAYSMYKGILVDENVAIPE